jgi:amino-acid N-acetyltransferase
MSDSSTVPSIRSANPDDLQAVCALLEPFVHQRKLLPRTVEEVARLLPHGFIAQADDQVIGFAAVEVYSRKMAEIQCLAVDEGWRGRGLGKQLVQHCVQRARELGVRELMAITASENLFRDCGFDYSLPDQKKALFIQFPPE